MDDYVTTDTFQAAIFLTLGHQIREMNSTDPKIKFVFDKTEQFNNDLMDLVNDKILVEPNSLKSNLDLLYSKVFQLRPR